MDKYIIQLYLENEICKLLTNVLTIEDKTFI